MKLVEINKLEEKKSLFFIFKQNMHLSKSSIFILFNLNNNSMIINIYIVVKLEKEFI